ncbi:hypothetical protein Tco_1518244 [Tanacetum coccineum]
MEQLIFSYTIPTTTAQSSKNVNPCRVTNLNAGTNAPKQPSNTFVSSTSKAGPNLNSSITIKNGGTNDHTCSSNIPTSNLYVALSQEFDSENYRRSGEGMESEEEVEVVFDEFANLLKSTSTGASTNTASDSFAILVLFYL